ncbi:MAG: hypothetical protein LJE65_04240 [Desulfobacteraceae bacterium]|nr:hypothetical protein [Desulfobacteraceae bacterium]
MHDHHHHQPETTGGSLSFDDKLLHRIRHWEEHNRDHAATFRDWSEKAADAGWPEVAACLEKAADATLAVNRHFRSAAEAMQRRPNRQE